MQKGIVTLIVVLSSVSALLAQTEKGSVLVGTQIGNLAVGTQNGTNSLVARLSPVAGVFVANRLAVGLGLPIFISRNRYDNNAVLDQYNTFQLGVTPFLRYYVNTPNETIKPYVGASAGYTTTTIKVTRTAQNEAEKSTSGGFLYGLQLGCAYFVSNRVSLDLSMNLADGEGGANQASYNNIGLGVSQPRVLTLSLGFQLFFRK